MRALNTNPNVDNSDLANYPGGRIKNNTGTGNGTPVNEKVYGDLHQAIAKLMRLYGISPNNLPDNEVNGYQIIDAIVAVASKNDFQYSLTLNAGVISVPIKLGYMKENEQIICKAGFDYGTESEIKGSDATTFAISVVGNFKTNEYVRLTKTASAVEVVRIADYVSFNSIASDLLFLKKASQTEENAGTIDTVATTPKVNKVTFTKRVNGTDSPTYLATGDVNGLYSKEHFVLVEQLRAVKNVGWFSGLNVGSGTAVGTELSVSGDIASAIVTVAVSNFSEIEITLANSMTTTNYKVEYSIESNASTIQDSQIGCPIFKVISATKFRFSIRELGSEAQSLKVHIKVVKL